MKNVQVDRPNPDYEVLPKIGYPGRQTRLDGVLRTGTTTPLFFFMTTVYVSQFNWIEQRDRNGFERVKTTSPKEMFDPCDKV